MSSTDGFPSDGYIPPSVEDKTKISQRTSTDRKSSRRLRYLRGGGPTYNTIKRPSRRLRDVPGGF